MRLIGIEPTHAAPEATALSTELQTHLYHDTILFSYLQGDLLIFWAHFDMIVLSFGGYDFMRHDWKFLREKDTDTQKKMLLPVRL